MQSLTGGCPEAMHSLHEPGHTVGLQAAPPDPSLLEVGPHNEGVCTHECVHIVHSYSRAQDNRQGGGCRDLSKVARRYRVTCGNSSDDEAVTAEELCCSGHLRQTDIRGDSVRTTGGGGDHNTLVCREDCPWCDTTTWKLPLERPDAIKSSHNHAPLDYKHDHLTMHHLTT